MTTSFSSTPTQMYVDAAIRFRDPFVSSKDCSAARSHAYDRTRYTWAPHARHHDINRALTPPPEMTGVHSSSRPTSLCAGEFGQQHSEYLPSKSVYRGPAASYHQSTEACVPHPYGRAVSPKQAPIEPTVDYPQQRRGSQHHNAIATNFQIPRTVNDSGGSLSELAAQITCLFWFESSDLLQQVEESSITLPSPKPLASDARPTTGFRKWVTTILSTTCVAQNVVILALLFIYRLKKLNPTVKGKPGSEYRLLTVALMLGNKFLDDNTYTNKTWAEVSGINVAEVHIMEVEFLSNMKYCLFTSEQDWAQWQSLLGKFASFFDQATRPAPRAQLAPLLPPGPSLHLPPSLPSPPASNQASPPHTNDPAQHAAQHANVQHGPTPAPSPLGAYELHSAQQAGVKRSREESTGEPPAKRMAGARDYTSPNRHSTLPVQPNSGAPVPRLTLPSLNMSGSQTVTINGPHQLPHNPQLPPLSVPARAMAMVYPAASHPSQQAQPVAAAGAGQQYLPQAQHASRHHSPQQMASAVASPSTMVPQSASSLHAPAQISPNYFLQQRASPYRPIHHVSTLLYPPPSGATQARPHNIELNQMQYQPLGKPTTHHTGRLPYVGQNLWLDGNHPQEMTPVHRWPNFPQQHSLPSLQ